MYVLCYSSFFFFFNDTATTEIYTLSLHDALPIFDAEERRAVALVADLEPRLDVVVPRHEDVHASGRRCGAQRRRHGDLDPGALGALGTLRGDVGGKRERDDDDRSDGGETQRKILKRAR